MSQSTATVNPSLGDQENTVKITISGSKIVAEVPGTWNFRDVDELSHCLTGEIKEDVVVFFDVLKKVYRVLPFVNLTDIDPVRFFWVSIVSSPEETQTLPPNAAITLNGGLQNTTFHMNASAFNGMFRPHPPSSAQQIRNHRQATGHVPRPPNSWILYRTDKSREIRMSPQRPRTAGEISQMVAEMWRNESGHIRHHYYRLAEAASEQHKVMYPGYKYVARR